MNTQKKSYILELTESEANRIALLGKEKNGIICKKCGSTEHYRLNTKDQHQCKVCRFRTTVKSGTAMQHSKISVKQWLIACWYLSKQGKGVSGLRLVELLELKTYKSVHLLLMKIRNVMSIKQIQIIGNELDKFNKICIQLSIRGTQGTAKDCLIANYKDSAGNFRIQLISSEDLGRHQPQKNASNGKARSHPWQLHTVEFLPTLEEGQMNGWVKKHLANLERNLNGIHNGVSEKYRQLYFDEFAYRTNLRMARQNVFECLLNDLLSTLWNE
jgi:hypothetical protein